MLPLLIQTSAPPWKQGSLECHSSRKFHTGRMQRSLGALQALLVLHSLTEGQGPEDTAVHEGQQDRSRNHWDYGYGSHRQHGGTEGFPAIPTPLLCAAAHNKIEIKNECLPRKTRGQPSP